MFHGAIFDGCTGGEFIQIGRPRTRPSSFANCGVEKELRQIGLRFLGFLMLVFLLRKNDNSSTVYPSFDIPRNRCGDETSGRPYPWRSVTFSRTAAIHDDAPNRLSRSANSQGSSPASSSLPTERTPCIPLAYADISKNPSSARYGKHNRRRTPS